MPVAGIDNRSLFAEGECAQERRAVHGRGDLVGNLVHALADMEHAAATVDDQSARRLASLPAAVGAGVVDHQAARLTSDSGDPRIR